jgi:RNA-directed DNA polymerase
MSDNPQAHGRRESHRGVVPMKPPHEDQGGSQEVVEGRLRAKENAEQPNPCRTQSRASGLSGLDRVRQAAKGNKQMKFTALPTCCITSIRKCCAAVITT